MDVSCKKLSFVDIIKTYPTAITIPQGAAITYAYDANGRGLCTPERSERGNMTSRTVGSDTFALAYDAENRLVAVMKAGLKVAEYVYDGDGQLALEKDYATSQTNPDKTLYFDKYFEIFIDADYEPSQGGVVAPDCANQYCVYLPIIIGLPPMPVAICSVPCATLPLVKCERPAGRLQRIVVDIPGTTWKRS